MKEKEKTGTKIYQMNENQHKHFLLVVSLGKSMCKLKYLYVSGSQMLMSMSKIFL